jgi:tRNA pseudouridine55 synthase
MFSAKKVNGQKLYQLARNNKSINIKPQLVKLINFQIMGFNHGVLKLTLTVSKGFYIRSLANDLGAKLQSCATLIELKRTKSGQFHIIDSITMDQLLKDKKRYE